MLTNRIKAFIKMLIEKEMFLFASEDNQASENIFYKCLYDALNNSKLTDENLAELGLIADIFKGNLKVLNMNFDNTELNADDQNTAVLFFKLEILINLANKVKNRDITLPDFINSHWLVSKLDKLLNQAKSDTKTFLESDQIDIKIFAVISLIIATLYTTYFFLNVMSPLDVELNLHSNYVQNFDYARGRQIDHRKMTREDRAWGTAFNELGGHRYQIKRIENVKSEAYFNFFVVLITLATTIPATVYGINKYSFFRKNPIIKQRFVDIEPSINELKKILNESDSLLNTSHKNKTI